MTFMSWQHEQRVEYYLIRLNLGNCFITARIINDVQPQGHVTTTNTR